MSTNEQQRVFRATWNTEQFGDFKPWCKSSIRYKKIPTGKCRNLKQRNKLKNNLLLVIIHNNKVPRNILEHNISNVMANEIRREIDNEILQSLMGGLSNE